MLIMMMMLATKMVKKRTQPWQCEGAPSDHDHGDSDDDNDDEEKDMTLGA